MENCAQCTTGENVADLEDVGDFCIQKCQYWKMKSREAVREPQVGACVKQALVDVFGSEEDVPENVKNGEEFRELVRDCKDE
jgi:hypothetical protein